MSVPRTLPLHDPQARPSSWNERMFPGEFAVLYSSRHDCTVFSSREEAEQHAREQVEQQPSLRCRIYDESGFARQPLAEIAGASFQGESEITPRFRRWFGGSLLSVGMVLVLIDWASGFKLSWPALVGSRLLIPGLVLLAIEALVLLNAKQKRRDPGMTLLLLQFMVVLLTTLLCGFIARKLGQGRVIGEIIGGILLGPSVFMRLAPHTSAALFPPGSLAPFDVLSTVGLILFLFLIGTELDIDQLRRHKGTAALASGMSMLVPFIMAALISHPLRVRFAPKQVGGWPFFLFLGISLSITAFPVLARILEERKLQATPLGVTALTCAAVDDVCGWSLLAVALTLLPKAENPAKLPYRFLGLGIYLLVMFGLVRPFGQWVARRRGPAPKLFYEILGIVAAIVLGSAAATNAIGVHPLFGAFLAGVCFPRIAKWQSAVRARLDMLVSVFLLPLFFALTGMRTRMDLLHGWNIWFWTLVILVSPSSARLAARSWAHGWRGNHGEKPPLWALCSTPAAWWN